MRKILTLDVGGTFIKYAIMSGTQSFKINKQSRISTPKKSHEEFLKALANVFKSHSDVEGIAVSMPGLIDTQRGICVAGEVLKFNNGHCIAGELGAICSVPVTIENDANCAALAEITSGSLADVNDAFVLVFGTAVGGAFVHNREIYRGAHFCAGEVSFTLKDMTGTAEEKNWYLSSLSSIAFQKSCAKILGMSPDVVTGEMIFDLIDENNDDMLDALYTYAHGIAVKIFNLQMLFDPERFALGGGVSIRQSFIDAVQDKIDELCADAPSYMPHPQVVACKYHNDANLYGALYRYLREYGDRDKDGEQP